MTLITILAVAVGVRPFAQLVLLVGILLIFMAFAAALFAGLLHTAWWFLMRYATKSAGVSP